MVAAKPRGCRMNSELIDKIYESCFAPQVWPEVLDEVGRIGDAPGASLFFSRGGDQRCVTSPEPRERAERIVREGWLARGPNRELDLEHGARREWPDQQAY